MNQNKQERPTNHFFSYVLFTGILLAFCFFSTACSSPKKEESSAGVAPTGEPSVSSVTPEDGATGIPIEDPVVITFNRPMESSKTLVSCGSTPQIQISIDNSSCARMDTSHKENRIYSFTPTDNLSYATKYYVNITTNVTDAYGNAFKTLHSTSFMTRTLCGSENGTTTDVANCSWTENTVTGHWGKRYKFGNAVFGGKMWVIGGKGSDGSYYNDVWSTPDGITWTEVSAGQTIAWPGRDMLTAVDFNGQLYILGGDRKDNGVPTFFNDVWYSSDGATWLPKTAAAEWTARAGHVHAVFKDKMWVMGGKDINGAPFQDVWSSSDGITWTEAATPGWSARYGAGVTIFDNKMWIMGGENTTTGIRANDVWYTSDGETWTDASADGSWAGRDGAKVFTFDNKLWIMGGSIGSSKKDVWYSDAGKTWTELSAGASHWAIRKFSGGLVFDDKVWILGGYDGSGASGWYNDVWSLGL